MVIGLLNAIGIMNKLLKDLNELVQVAVGGCLIEVVRQPVADGRHIVRLRPVQDKRSFRQIDQVDDQASGLL